jgi:hypothetical protein
MGLLYLYLALGLDLFSGTYLTHVSVVLVIENNRIQAVPQVLCLKTELAVECCAVLND